MSLTNSPFWFSSGATSAGGGGTVVYPYSINQSLRFNDNDSAKLYFDPTVDGNKQVWTFSAWVKRSNLGLSPYSVFFSGTNSSGHQTDIRFDSADQLRIVTATAALNMDFKTNRVFRDTSSWYHIVVAVDTTDATLLNRVKIYVNGVQETSLATTTCTQNSNCILNTAASQTTNVGALGYTTNVIAEFDGYMAEVHFVDGTQYAASDFGETINGIWVPKEVSGLTYGTNGFYFTFEGTGTATTTQGITAQTNIGDDQAGAGNNFTVIQSVPEDVVLDSPTNNFCTLNAADFNGTLSDGNLSYRGSDQCALGTIALPSEGKWYWEFQFEDSAINVMTGVADGTFSDFDGILASANIRVFNERPEKADASRTYPWGTAWNVNEIIQVACDMDNGAIYFGIDNTWQESGDPESGASKTGAAFTDLISSGKTWRPIVGSTNATGGGTFNFGQDSTFAGDKTAQGNTDANGRGDFYYAPPSGFLALCSANLPEPPIGPNSTTTSDQHFNTVLYTGNASTNAITGVGFQPDFLWVKRRNSVAHHNLIDSVRGVKKHLSSSATNAEDTEGASNGLASFDADGFTWAGVNTGTGAVNSNGDSFVGWNWKAGGTASTIAVDTYSAGVPSIASSVSANPDAGFSIVSWDALGFSTGTVGHGLTVAPDLIIAKARDHGTNWFVQVPDVLANTHILNLETTAAAFNPGINHFNDTVPTDSVFSIGGYLGNHPDIGNTNTDKIAYCFHSVDGFSKVGSYVGNGSAGGTFVYTGFRPAWVMVKRTDNTSNWQIWDATRNEYNVTNLYLLANTDGAEVVGSGGSIGIDILSNGFKFRSTASNWNALNGSYIYLCFAEAPAKYSNAR